MVFTVNHIKYSLALTVGLAIGWQLNLSPTNQQTNAVNSLANDHQRGDIDLSNAAVVSQQNATEPSTDQKVRVGLQRQDSRLLQDSLVRESNQEENFEQLPDFATFSIWELIEYFDNLSTDVFWHQLNDMELRSAIQESPTLLGELVLEVVGMKDSARRQKYLLLLEVTNYRNSNTEITEGVTAPDFPVEDWIMQQIDAGYRSKELISLLSQMNTRSRETYMYLVDRLGDYNEPGQQAAILSALARRSSFFNESLSDADQQRTRDIIEPLFSSNNDAERMVAITSLTNFPLEKTEPRLLTALTDESRRVRITTMKFIRDNENFTPDLSKLLIVSLENRSLSAYERLGAYEVLSRAPLDQKQYEAIIRFAKNERAALEKEFRIERDAAQGKN